jgi:DNA-binding transcriptional LysR family regulator
MRRPPPPLHLIRSFECAARHLSFTRAAEELGYTQAAISTHIRALEHYVGRKLFVRRARSLALTEIGEAFLPTLRQALNQIDRATDAVVTGSRQKSVVLACPVSLAENWLPDHLTAFNAAHPEIEVLVHATVWDSPGDDIADISISIHRDGEAPETATPLWRETLSLVASPDVASRLADPQDLPLVQRIGIAGRQDDWPVMFEALGLSAPRTAAPLRTNSTNVALELAASGAGVAVALTTLAEAYVKRGLLVRPFMAKPASPWTYMIRSLAASPGPSVRLLGAWLRTAGAR